MKGGKKGKRWALLLTVLLVVGLIGSFNLPLFAQQKEISFLMWSSFVPSSNLELQRQINEWNKKHPDVKARIDFDSLR